MDDPIDIPLTDPFQVGDWVADPDTGRLQNQDEEIKIEPKVMQVLVYLAEHQGKVVSREELEAAAWAGMVVGYDAVSGSIIKLRKALGDNSRNPQYIETVSKKGYRLIAPVSPELDESQISEASHSTPTVQPLTSTNKINNLFVAGITLLFVTGLLFFIGRGPDNSDESVSAIAITPSIIVIPFKNLSGDPQQEYFSDGITDDLITDLSRVDSVRVIAPQTSYHFKNNPDGLQNAARKLGVSYIIEGSARKSGDQIRVNVQLTNTEKGESVWARRFDTNTNDIFKAQDDIVKHVMDAMVVTLSSGITEHISARGTKNFEAYDAFLLGQQYIKTRSRQGYDLTMNAYRRAIEIDPNYARAYGAMAVTLTRGYRYQWTDLSLVEARERALELAKKAVNLNQSTPQIYWSLGYVHLHRREYDAAESAVKQSIDLSPNYADGYALLANIANWRGNAEDAINYINKAISLNPYYTFQYPSTLGLAYYNLGQYKEAVTVLRDSLERNENALNPRLILAAAYVQLNRMDEAAWEIEQINTNHPDATLTSLNANLPFEDKKYIDALRVNLRKSGLSD